MSKDNKPKAFSKEIKHAAKCALQRAIILAKESILNGKIVYWLDIEIPVDRSGKARGKCVDLIGKDEDGKYVLCELKFRKNYRDNGIPDEAAIQLKEYFDLIKTNSPHIHGHEENGGEIDWEKVAKDNPRLVVAANKRYWETWFGPRKKDMSYDLKGIECYSINVEEDAFEKQKKGKETYKPKLDGSQNMWAIPSRDK